LLLGKWVLKRSGDLFSFSCVGALGCVSSFKGGGYWRAGLLE
jgi:hypothetical protein